MTQEVTSKVSSMTTQETKTRQQIHSELFAFALKECSSLGLPRAERRRIAHELARGAAKGIR